MSPKATNTPSSAAPGPPASTPPPTLKPSQSTISLPIPLLKKGGSATSSPASTPPPKREGPTPDPGTASTKTKDHRRPPLMRHGTFDFEGSGSHSLPRPTSTVLRAIPGVERRLQERQEEELAKATRAAAEKAEEDAKKAVEKERRSRKSTVK